jgi:phosphatidylglycerol:prolipoprotein diacylglycerol transferase
MLLYGASRFVVEFYRGDPRGSVFGLLSTSQFIALIIVPVAIFMLYWLGRPMQSAGATPRPLERAPQAS